MKDRGIKQGRYYEHFQVEDVFTFYNGQLVLARSPDGGQVFLQEVKMKRPLPPGSREILYNLGNFYVVPVLDIIEEEGQIVLVHPPLAGEPLSLLVNERNPMKPFQALVIFRRLLRAAVRLSKLPLPLYTTLDPRNIIMEGDRPFLLFLSFEKWDREEQEQAWRYLLYFLLTGVRLESPLRHPERDPRLEELPDSLKKLVSECMNGARSVQQVLDLAENTIIPNKRKVKTAGSKKKLLYPAAVAVLAAAGFVLGIQAVGTDAFFRTEGGTGQEQGWAQTVPDMVFDGAKPETRDLPFSFRGAARVIGQLSMEENGPFALTLVSEHVEASFGVQVEANGGISLVQYSHGETYELADSGNAFPVRPGRAYWVEILYVPDEPFRVAVSDQKSGRKWVAVGKVPMDSTYQVQVKGMKGTVLSHTRVSQVSDANEALVRWMDNNPWQLINGSGTFKNGVLHVQRKSYIQVGATPRSSFVFRRPSRETGGLQLDLENVDGTRYRMMWRKEGQLVLYRLGYGVKRLADAWLPGNGQSEEEIHVSVDSGSTELIVEVKQGKVKGRIRHVEKTPLVIQNVYFTADPGVELVSRSTD